MSGAAVSPMAEIAAKLDAGEIADGPGVGGSGTSNDGPGDAPDPKVASQAAAPADAPDPGQASVPAEQPGSAASDPTNPVPYKRFHGVIQERNAARQQIAELQKQLEAAQASAEQPPWLEALRGQQGQQPSESDFFDNLFSDGAQPQGQQPSALPPQMKGYFEKLTARLDELEAQNKTFLQDRTDREYVRHIGNIHGNNEHVPEDMLVKLAVLGVPPDQLQELAVGLQGHIHGLLNPAQGGAAPAAAAPAPPAAPRPAAAPSAKAVEREGMPDPKEMQDDRKRLAWLHSIADRLPAGGLYGT